MAKKAAPAKSKALTKTALYDELAKGAGITRKQVAQVFEGIADLAKKALRKDGDTLSLPGLLRLKLTRKKAVKGGKTVPNPFKPGETMVTKDRPARNVIKAMALKNLKDKVQ